MDITAITGAVEQLKALSGVMGLAQKLNGPDPGQLPQVQGQRPPQPRRDPSQSTATRVGSVVIGPNNAQISSAFATSSKAILRLSPTPPSKCTTRLLNRHFSSSSLCPSPSQCHQHTSSRTLGRLPLSTSRATIHLSKICSRPSPRYRQGLPPPSGARPGSLRAWAFSKPR